MIFKPFHVLAPCLMLKCSNNKSKRKDHTFGWVPKIKNQCEEADTVCEESAGKMDARNSNGDVKVFPG